MRRFVNGLLVVCLVASLTAPTAYATPRRDDGGGLGDTYFRTPIRKIVQVVKRIVKGLDGGDVTWPKP
jgi:hypothetical protein